VHGRISQGANKPVGERARGQNGKGEKARYRKKTIQWGSQDLDLGQLGQDTEIKHFLPSLFSPELGAF